MGFRAGAGVGAAIDAATDGVLTAIGAAFTALFFGLRAFAYSNHVGLCTSTEVRNAVITLSSASATMAVMSNIATGSKGKAPKRGWVDEAKLTTKCVD